MAARKSCTHLTWSDAKAGGTDSSNGGSNSKGQKSSTKKLSHQQVLAQRMKQGGKFVDKKQAWTRQQIDKNMSAQDRARREDHQAAIQEFEEAQKQEEVRLSKIVKPHEQARARMALLALQLQHHSQSQSPLGPQLPLGNGKDKDIHILIQMAECLAAQLEEISALEAIYTDSDEFLVSAASNDLVELRESLDSIIDGEYQDEEALRSLFVVDRPMLSFSLQLTLENDNSDNSDSNNNGQELVASILLHVTLPPFYPKDPMNTPVFGFEYVMVTDKRKEQNIDKALESLSYLDIQGVLEQMKQESQLIQPDPCVYELAATFLAENAFHYMTMHTHCYK